jgi:hypothetical protein
MASLTNLWFGALEAGYIAVKSTFSRTLIALSALYKCLGTLYVVHRLQSLTLSYPNASLV